ncbi:hypothetical protein CCYA_CCYA02G0713 [Cyanidiococcus yangmingshanensis]|nr:hypothetical protein CCYA_CCYA02G0713 [Cyanidiococcus yangmingshanensis]
MCDREPADVVYAGIWSASALAQDDHCDVDSDPEALNDPQDDRERGAVLQRLLSSAAEDVPRHWPRRLDETDGYLQDSNKPNPCESVYNVLEGIGSSRKALLLGRCEQPEGSRLVLQIQGPDDSQETRMELAPPSRAAAATEASLPHAMLLCANLWNLALDEDSNEEGNFRFGVAASWSDATLQLMQLEYDPAAKSLSVIRMHQALLTPTMQRSMRQPTETVAEQELGPSRSTRARNAVRKNVGDCCIDMLKQRWTVPFVVGVEHTAYCVVLVAEQLQSEDWNRSVPETRRRTRSMRHVQSEQEASFEWRRSLQLWDTQYGVKHWSGRVKFNEMIREKTNNKTAPILAKQYPPWAIYEHETARFQIGWSEAEETTDPQLWIVALNLPLPRTVRMVDLLGHRKKHHSLMYWDRADTLTELKRQHSVTEPRSESASTNQVLPRDKQAMNADRCILLARQREETLLAAIQTGSRALWTKVGGMALSARSQVPRTMSMLSGDVAADSKPNANAMDSSRSPTVRTALLQLNRACQEYFASCSPTAPLSHLAETTNKPLLVRYEEMRAAFPEAATTTLLSDLIPWVPLGYHCNYIPVEEQLPLLLHHLRRLQTPEGETSRRLASDLIVCSLYVHPRPSRDDANAVLRQLPLRDVCCILTDASRRLEGMPARLDSMTANVLDGALILCMSLLDLHWAELVLSESSVLFGLAKGVYQVKEGLESAQHLQGILEQWIQKAQRT